MQDEHKTKKQLVDELAKLRQRLSQERRSEALDRDDPVRQRMEEALRASVAQWYATFNAMSDAICLIDPQGKIQRCNRAMTELLDRPLGEILGHHCWEVVHGTSEPIDGCPVAHMWENRSRESLSMPFGDRWFSVSVDPILDDDEQIVGVVHVMTNITEQKQAEEALTHQAKQLRRLSARLADAQEAERQRMARELHDQVGQNLTALGINLNILRPYLAQAPEVAQASLDELLALVKETTSRIRGVMVDLRPPELDDYGLLSALRWYAEQVGTRTGLAIVVEGKDLYPRLPSRQETALFRIAQEALTNVVKHAQATRATVSVKVDEETVRMTIVDDGVGFDLLNPGRTRAAPHWGLLTMQERAQVIGARWHIESSPGQGTRVIVETVRRKAADSGEGA
jgi:PAS domain S-box-containing protein